jgi:hypothetical protein
MTLRGMGILLALLGFLLFRLSLGVLFLLRGFPLLGFGLVLLHWWLGEQGHSTEQEPNPTNMDMVVFIAGSSFLTKLPV